MTLLRRLLLLPLLAPLLLVVWLALLNPRPALSLRLLIWRSPSLSLGSWLALAGGGGALLSASATALALSQASRRPLGWQQSRRPPDPSERWRESRQPESRWRPEPQEETPRSRAASAPRAAAAPPVSAAAAGPSRSPGEPAPTVEVPFRVIRRGHGGATSPGPFARSRAATATGPATDSAPADAAPRSPADAGRWARASGSQAAATAPARDDDWDSPAESEDW
ncbi:MAG: hypothetical protein VKK62_06895 [Synechococcaceae cyanobacterium]|nr:hypothetical protein [Synechococcaceae cyanobacterium]